MLKLYKAANLIETLSLSKLSYKYTFYDCETEKSFTMGIIFEGVTVL